MHDPKLLTIFSSWGILRHGIYWVYQSGGQGKLNGSCPFLGGCECSDLIQVCLVVIDRNNDRILEILSVLGCGVPSWFYS